MVRSLSLVQRQRLLVFLRQVEADIRGWINPLEADVHHRHELQPTERAPWERLQRVLSGGIIHVQAAPTKRSNLEDDGAEYPGGEPFKLFDGGETVHGGIGSEFADRP